jgi:glutathione S-transferase
MLKIWGRRSAFNVQKVLWTLEELALPYERVEAGGSAGGLDTAEFRNMNPHGRIPVIRDGPHVIWESHAIVRYLAATYGADPFWSPDPKARSLAERWMDWSLATLQPAFMDLFWGYFRTPEGSRDARAIDDAMARCERHFRILDDHLETRKFVAGNEFTMGDIPAGTTLYRYFGMGVPVAKPTHVWAWYERLKERPPFQGSIMIPFEELRGRLDY